MNMDFESEAFARHHDTLSGGVHTFVESLLAGIAALQRRRFAAPWRTPPRHAR
ncbi:hypothetical protein [Sphingomonas sp. BK235]|jgi:hypothetical protein|uniref:hypothetical protein n=1 Tax=Sphingomonas sp. BK235 TaxID=2512131 RepID=UPI0010E5E927|nr:hypothetical protein [Sphingomonas sp. BK235]TCP36796.1 hypothetical protein EV292_101294 [Sphingomonas sp. BK235]